ncbi:MAG: nucleotide sugar dehydrogenase [Nitrospirae bacterium]|nr:nucleotide sugar dehydrogenase [Nitrospirota bacterium]
MNPQDALLNKIYSHAATVGVIGLGYVGLPLVLRCVEEGFTVLGFDTDETKVSKLLSGVSYIGHIASDSIRSIVARKRFTATTDFSKLSTADCVLICVPTPLTPHREPDLSYVLNTLQAIAKSLRAGQLVALESTTYPGTTEEVVRPILEDKGLKAGADFFLVFSPEREDPGNGKFPYKTIPKVLGGMTPNCLKIGEAFYAQLVQKVVPVSSTRVAEMTKLLENIYRSVNIALVNEMKILCDRMGINLWEVIDAAATKPYGFTPFYPGPGLGGHCIPIDPFYLTWKARQYDVTTRFIELAGEVNTAMPYYVVSKVVDALNQRGKSIKEARILVLGVAYKKDVDDKRESPGLKIIELLMSKGADVSYNDSHVPSFEGLRHYDFAMQSVPLTEEKLGQMDAMVIVTDHSSYDYQWIVDHAALVIDTRNATKHVINGRAKIIR